MDQTNAFALVSTTPTSTQIPTPPTSTTPSTQIPPTNPTQTPTTPPSSPSSTTPPSSSPSTPKSMTPTAIRKSSTPPSIPDPNTTGDRDVEIAELCNMDDHAFSDKMIRRNFIKKVYGVLTCQLVVTFSIVAVFLLVKGMKDFIFDNMALFWTTVALSLALVLVMSFCNKFRRKTPYNYIALSLFTLCMSYLLGCVAMFYETTEVLIAVGATIVVTLALTAFAFQTKWDFTCCTGLLFVLIVVFMFFGITASIMHNNVLSALYPSLGALLFSFCIVVDTQLMMGADHKLAISPEEYIFAALNLYLDVINLFLYLLRLFGGEG